MPYVPKFVLALAVMLAPVAASAQLADPDQAPALMVQAVTAQDPAAVAALYTDDAILLPSTGQTLQGHEAISQAWASNFAHGYTGLEILQSRTERGQERAATLMVWQATIRQGGRDQTIRGRSLIYYVQTANGWLISADMSQVAG